ncbi:hypothetical protein O9992_11620 [Vibrio lentus]|nr:hypothetical protein [Vibrio lentus]
MSERTDSSCYKGHEVDAEGLNYKSGDKFLASAKVRVTNKRCSSAVMAEATPLSLIHYRRLEAKVRPITGRPERQSGYFDSPSGDGRE